MAWASLKTKVVAEPKPDLAAEPRLRDEPGITINKLAPKDWKLFLMSKEAPCPMATILITEAMPMTMPKIVRAERDLLAERANWVSCNKSEKNIIYLFFK